MPKAAVIESHHFRAMKKRIPRTATPTVFMPGRDGEISSFWGADN
jgi:hypothetical protein